MTTTQTTPAPSIATTSPLSLTALILGVSSVVFGQTFIVPIAAIVLGILGFQREPLGRTLAVWAIVLGALMLFGWVLLLAVGALFFAPFLFFAWV